MKVQLILGGASSIAAGVVSYFLLSMLFPYVAPHCADNWHSYSIGLQGACSHHGGVASSGLSQGQDLYISMVIAFGFFAQAFEASKKRHRNHPAHKKTEYVKPNFSGTLQAKSAFATEAHDIFREQINLITQAMTFNRCIVFSYSGQNCAMPMPVRIKPLYVECHTNDKSNLFVVGRTPQDGRVQTYSLKDMSDISITDALA